MNQFNPQPSNITIWLLHCYAHHFSVVEIDSMDANHVVKPPTAESELAPGP